MKTLLRKKALSPGENEKRSWWKSVLKSVKKFPVQIIHAVREDAKCAVAAGAETAILGGHKTTGEIIIETAVKAAIGSAASVLFDKKESK